MDYHISHLFSSCLLSDFFVCLFLIDLPRSYEGLQGVFRIEKIISPIHSHNINVIVRLQALALLLPDGQEVHSGLPSLPPCHELHQEQFDQYFKADDGPRPQSVPNHPLVFPFRVREKSKQVIPSTKLWRFMCALKFSRQLMGSRNPLYISICSILNLRRSGTTVISFLQDKSIQWSNFSTIDDPLILLAFSSFLLVRLCSSSCTFFLLASFALVPQALCSSTSICSLFYRI